MRAVKFTPVCPRSFLLRLPLALLLVCVRLHAAELTPDAVREAEAGEEAVQLFFVSKRVLSVDKAQKELSIVNGAQ